LKVLLIHTMEAIYWDEASLHGVMTSANLNSELQEKAEEYREYLV
jgi:hypothetical protein